MFVPEVPAGVSDSSARPFHLDLQVESVEQVTELQDWRRFNVLFRASEYGLMSPEPPSAAQGRPDAMLLFPLSI